MRSRSGRVALAAVLTVACVVPLGALGVFSPGSGRAALPPLLASLLVPTTAGSPSAGAVPDLPCAKSANNPNSGLQGEVPLRDRVDGRSTKGYWCNLTLVGQYQGDGASWVSPTYKNCAYMSPAWPGDLTGAQKGVRVVNVANPAHPVLSDVLTSPAMQSGTWESLKVNTARGLLAAVSAGTSDGVGFFDVYDISKDCAHPRLLNGFASTALTLPASGLGHEGGWAPDGRTYYAAGVTAGLLTAIDVSDPEHPKILWVGSVNVLNHGFSFSANGEEMYLSDLGNGAGIDVLNTSRIQNRDPLPQVTSVGGLHWSDGSFTQASIPITYHGAPYLIAWDELSNGGVRFLNIANPAAPTIASHIRLAVDLPQNAGTVASDTAHTGSFGYQSHYCSVDRQDDPDVLACAWFQSGIRVFDIRDILHPVEIAYFVPPAQTGKNRLLPDSEHAEGLNGGGPDDIGNTQLTSDYCSSPPSFVGQQLWVTCQDNGFMVLRFSRSVTRFLSPPVRSKPRKRRRKPTRHHSTH